MLLVVSGLVVAVVVVPVTVVGVVVVVVPVTAVEGVEDVGLFEREFRSKGTVDTVFRSLISTSGLCKFGTLTTPFSQL